MIVEIKGTIKRIEDTVKVSDSFSKRVVVITIPDGEHTQDVGVEFTQDRTAILNNFKAGQEVECTANVTGRDWTTQDGTTKNFVSFRGWKIDLAGETVVDNAETFVKEGDDDLPF